MKRNPFIAACTAALLLLLAGCGHEHDYQPVACDQPLTCTVCGATEGEVIGHDFAEATCTEPKTCKRCGATEGEALGHDLSEATCTEAPTCKRCGATEGEPLGHDLSEANYQDPPTCSRCGAIEGEKLKGSFEEHGMVCNAKADTDIPYTTDVYEEVDAQTTGTVRFSDFKCFKGDDTFPEKDGYVWLTVHMTADYTDDAAWEYGYRTGICIEDYYTVEAHDDSMKHEEKMPAGFEKFDEYSTYKVNYHGQEYDCVRVGVTDKETGWVEDKHAHVGHTYWFQVPDGYDGSVLGFYHNHRDKEWKEGMYIYDVADEEAIFFRLDPAQAAASGT